jgi:hypothetical protein
LNILVNFNEIYEIFSRCLAGAWQSPFSKFKKWQAPVPVTAKNFAPQAPAPCLAGTGGQTLAIGF